MGISVITINTQRSIILDGLGNKKCIPYSTYKYKKSRYTILWEKGLQVICQTGRSSKDASVERCQVKTCTCMIQSTLIILIYLHHAEMVTMNNQKHKRKSEYCS